MIREPHNSRWIVLVVVVVALGAAALAHVSRRESVPSPAQPTPSPPTSSPVKADAPQGSLRHEKVYLAYALLHVDPRTARRAPGVLRALAARNLPGYAVVPWKEGGPEIRSPAVAFTSLPAEAIDEGSLRYFSEAVTEGERKLLARPAAMTAVWVWARGEAAASALRGTTALVAAAAKELRAVVSDPEARLYYSAGAFEEKVAKGGFDGDLPIVERHVAIHSYAVDEGSLRSVTLGMSKLGLPDLFVSGHARTIPIPSLALAVAQRLAEDPVLAREGHLALDLRALRSEAARTPLLAAMKSDARGRADVTLATAEPQEGDAENRHLELTFGGFAGSPTERQAALCKELFGAKEEVIGAPKRDAELAAASERARRRLMELKPGIVARRAAGDSLHVKLPFDVDGDEHEYMWIEVLSWKGTTLRGVLENEPVRVKGLRKGAEVAAEERDVYDFALYNANGSSEGNETTKVLERR
jgi:uncharacterized protein YegJ (DUF2314 family)